LSEVGVATVDHIGREWRRRWGRTNNDAARCDWRNNGTNVVANVVLKLRVLVRNRGSTLGGDAACDALLRELVTDAKEVGGVAVAIG
jgi:hypothetical protein